MEATERGYQQVLVPVAVPGDRRVDAGNPVGRRRLALGWVLAVLVPAVVALVLHLTREAHALATVALLLLAGTVLVALVGGLRPAVASAVLSGVLSNVLFTEPYGTLRIDSELDVVTVLVQVAVAVGVSTAVDRAARGRADAARARAEADAVSAFAHAVLTGHDTVPDLLEQIRTSFGLDGVDLVLWQGPPEVFDAGLPSPPVLAAVGAGTDDPDAVCAMVQVDEEVGLRLAGPRLQAGELRVVAALAAQLAAVLERNRLRSEAVATRGEKERTRTRTALLRAVSHDLRTPLAGIKAGVSALRSDDIPLTAADRDDLLADVDASTDRLQALIDNLLDMSRLDAGVVVPRRDPTAVEDLVARALAGVPAGRVQVDVPPDLPLLQVDSGLLERALANVAENAVRHGHGAPVHVRAEQSGGDVVVRVADAGPGIDPDERERVFAPFQRLGDTAAAAGVGVGLGLAVARGLAEVSGGELTAEETPGGGLTMVLRLPVDGAGPGQDLVGPPASPWTTGT